MSRLSNLLRQVETQDPQLAADLKRGVEALSGRRAFGLNFEHHIPETRDEKENFAIHSLITLEGIAIALPFVIKAYRSGLPIDEIGKLCSSLEDLVLRHRLIETRADIGSRINDVFQDFNEKNKDICPIVTRIEQLKKASGSDWFRAFWGYIRVFQRTFYSMYRERY